MTAQPNYLDLDAIDTEFTLVVKLDGTDHKLQPISLEDFVANLRKIQEMGVTTDPMQEVEMLVEMLSKAFPSIGEPRLRKLTLPQLSALMEKAREFNGENAVTREAKAQLASEGNANPQTPKS